MTTTGTKHTDGPFKAMKDDDHGYTIYTDDADQMTVGYVYGENSEVGEADPEQARADALLFAASPDLLSASQQLAEAVGPTLVNYREDQMNPDQRLILQAVRAVRAAIAKATRERTDRDCPQCEQVHPPCTMCGAVTRCPSDEAGQAFTCCDECDAEMA